jgi:hypothetical protein
VRRVHRLIRRRRRGGGRSSGLNQTRAARRRCHQLRYEAYGLCVKERCFGFEQQRSCAPVELPCRAAPAAVTRPPRQ